jgi:phosphoenolpyruvate---glycerone phosphotransferase subunit DhaL
MGLTSAHIAAAVLCAAGRIREAEELIGEADAALGDGDTGVMLRRLLDKMAEVARAPSADVGETFRALGMAGAGATGSSLGTLIVVALLDLSKVTLGKIEIPWNQVSELLNSALQVMMARGKASLADKTVLDPLDAVAKAVIGKSDPAAIASAARTAARGTLADFRDRPCKVGRARVFAEKSIGQDDPGQLAFAMLLDAVCE